MSASLSTTTRDPLSRREQKELLKRIETLKERPDDPPAAARAGYLLSKAGKGEDASSYLWMAFRGFVQSGQYVKAVKAADDLLSIQVNNVELLHQLSQISEQMGIEIPVLKIYKKYSGLNQLPLFSELNEIEFLQLLKSARFLEVKENKTIIKEGAKGDEIYLIIEGRVRVTKRGQGSEETLLGVLEEGSFIGEIAYLHDRRRSATITSETPSRLLSWERQAIKELDMRHPEVTRVLLQAFWERSLDTVLSLSPLFSHLDRDTRKEIKKQLQMRSFSPKDAILREGEENPERLVYIIKRGEAAVFSAASGSFRRPLAVLKAGDIFGEYSALSNRPCTATIMARTPLDVLTLQREVFLKGIKEDDRLAENLERIGKERLNESLLQMSYFRFIEEIREEHESAGERVED